MENKILIEGPLGEVGNFVLEWKDNALVFTLGVKVGPLKSSVVTEVNSVEVFEEIAKAIPGTIDDVVIDLVKSVLLKKV